MNFEKYIPNYIQEELQEYLKLTKNGKYKAMKWENIKALLSLARINNRFTFEQLNFIIKKYNREKTS